MKLHKELFNAENQSYCRIEYHETKRLVVCCWNGEYRPWEIRKAYRELLAFLQENKGKFIRYISDDRKASPFCRDTTKSWVSQIFIPLLVEQGVKHVAFVANDEFMHNLLRK